MVITMKTGFSFKGIHCRDMGVYAATRSRSVMPEVRRATFEPDEADGVIDISACNVYNRFLYRERTFQVDICVSADDIFKLQRRMSAVARWLTGSGKLVFDDLPGVYWQASVTSPTEFAPTASGRKAVLTVHFNAQPFSCADNSAAEGIRLGSRVIRLGDHIPIGLRKTLTATSQNAADKITIRVYNIGDVPVKPVIKIAISEISGYNYRGTTIDKTAADGTVTKFEFTYDPYIKEAVIDMENGILTQDGTPFVPTDGSFFELEPGYSTIKVFSSVSNFKKTVTVDYRPRFFYGMEVVNADT